MFLPPNRKFRFENAWFLEDGLEDVVHGSWYMAGRNNLVSKLKGCADDLQVWGHGIRSKFWRDISKCKTKLADLVYLRDEQSIHQFNATKEKLAVLLLQQDNFWRQRAKVHWLKEGDMNTKFFHTMATTRKKRNFIRKLQNEEGVEVVDRDGLCTVAHNYFQNLYSVSPSRHGPVIDVVPARVTQGDNAMLMRHFCIEEFRDLYSKCTQTSLQVQMGLMLLSIGDFGVFVGMTFLILVLHGWKMGYFLLR